MNNTSDNSYATALKVIGWIIIVFGIIGSFVLGSSVPNLDDLLRGRYYGDFNYTIFFAGVLSSVFTGVLFLGFGEVIRLLDSSNRKLDGLSLNGTSVSEEKKEPEEQDTDNSTDELPYI